MFGISFTELAVVAVIALIVVGPQKLPGMLRTVGDFIRKMRRLTTEVRQQTGIDDILRQEGIQGGLTELRGMLRGDFGGAPAYRPATYPARQDPYANERVPIDKTREYPVEGPDAAGALPDDLVDDVQEAGVAAAPVIAASATPAAAATPAATPSPASAPLRPAAPSPSAPVTTPAGAATAAESTFAAPAPAPTTAPAPTSPPATPTVSSTAGASAAPPRPSAAPLTGSRPSGSQRPLPPRPLPPLPTPPRPPTPAGTTPVAPPAPKPSK